MTRLTWNENAPRVDGGVDRGVLYLDDDLVVPWNGLVQASFETVDSEVLPHFFDGQVVRMIESLGSFSATLEAYSYPKEFEPYDGIDGYLTQQRRKPFSVAWRTGREGNYQIHLAWNVVAKPIPYSRPTLSQTPTITSFAWALESSPLEIPYAAPSSHVVFDYKDVHAFGPVRSIDEIMFGSASADPRLPAPEEVIQIFDDYASLLIIKHDDGTWTATGPEVVVNGDGTYEITSPTAAEIGEYTHQVSTY